MEQAGGISIISPPALTDNNVGKEKSNGLSSTTTSRIMSAKEKICTPWATTDSAIEWIKKGIAEMIGTAIVVFVGCAGCVGSLGNMPTYLQLCLSFGFAVVIAITCVAHISGAHINPAVTVGSVVIGQQSLPTALVYFMGQTAGGIIGYALLMLITPEDFLHGGDPLTASSFCVTMLNPKVSIMQGFLTEMFATSILVFMACAVGDMRNSENTDSISIKFGLTVAGLCFAFVPYTNCSMNPARSFGPALLNNQWANHWIYWFGPFAGGLAGSLLYRTVYTHKESTTSTNNRV